MSNTMDGAMQAVAKDNIDRTMSGLKNGMASAASGVEQAQTTAREGVQKAMRTAEEMFAFGQGNLEAVTRAGQILATGMQGMGQSVAATARASAEEMINATKAMAGVKSFKEAMALQAGLFRSMLERAVTQTSQMTDSSMKLSEQVMAPITARIAMASEKFGQVG